MRSSDRVDAAGDSGFSMSGPSFMIFPPRSASRTRLTSNLSASTFIDLT